MNPAPPVTTARPVDPMTSSHPEDRIRARAAPGVAGLPPADWSGRPPPRSPTEPLPMLSARNQLPATVRSVTLGDVMAEVVMDVAGVEIVSAITRGSAEAL